MPLTRINIGPIHPGTHGVTRLVVDLDGDTIVNVEPHIGFLHRGVEKLAETRMYMQNPPYMEKLDYVAPMSADDLYVSTVEAALGIQVKERAKYIRTILLEIQRIASHLLWVGMITNDLGQMFTGFMWAFRDRELFLRLLQEATGQRMFYVNTRLGGVLRDFPSGFEEHVLGTLDHLDKRLVDYHRFIDRNPIFKERMKGVGVLKTEDAKALGVTGHVLRGSGVQYDVRSSNPYYVYNELNFKPQVQNGCDNLARYTVRMLELKESARLIRYAFQKMPAGDALGQPVKLVAPKVQNKVVTVARECPRGEELMYLVAGDQKPYRLAIRSPTFINLAALNQMVRGHRLADLYPTFGTLDLVMGDVDR